MQMKTMPGSRKAESLNLGEGLQHNKRLRSMRTWREKGSKLLQ